MKREDKKLYVYTTAFRQPIWVHKINEDFSLPFALKMSTSHLYSSKFRFIVVLARVCTLLGLGFSIHGFIVHWLVVWKFTS